MAGLMHRNYLYFTGVSTGVITALQLPGLILSATAFLCFAAWLLRTGKRRELLIFVFSAILGFTAVFFHRSNEALLRPQYLENAAVKIIDNNAVGPRWHAEDVEPASVTAEIVLNGARKKIRLNFPERCSNPGVISDLTYQVSGNLLPLELPTRFYLADKKGRWQDVSSDFRRSNYADYLKRHGICGTVFVENITLASQQKTSAMSRFRINAVKKLDHGLTEPLHRAIFGAVTLGIRYRLPGYVKQEYAQAGLAHIFSISGLHIGILAGLLLLALRPLPGIWHWLLLSTLSAYVMLTGGNAPAIRAFTMVLAIEFFRSSLLKVRPLEMLSLICAGLLVYNPYYITDAGFQYSFAVTAILIMAARPARDVISLFSGMSIYLAPLAPWKKFCLKYRGRLAGALFFCLTASAASSMLTLYWQQLYFSGSALVNLLVLPILMPIFVLALIKLLLPASCAALCNAPLEKVIDYLNWVCSTFGSPEPMSNLVRPHWFMVLLYMILLALLLIFMQRRLLRHSAAALAGLLLTVGIIFSGSAVQPEKAGIIIAGGRITEPACAIFLVHAHTMYLADIPRGAVEPLIDTAAAYGVNQIEQLTFRSKSMSSASGVNQLLKKLPVKSFRHPEGIIRSRPFRKLTAQLRSQPEAIKLNGSFLPSEKLSIRYTKARAGQLKIEFADRLYQIPCTSQEAVYIIPKR